MVETIGAYFICGLFALMILTLLFCEFYELIKFVWSKLKNGTRKRI